MTGSEKKEEGSDEAEKLGEVVGQTGKRPSDATIKHLKKNPKKMEEFLKGAEKGQRQRIDEEEESP